MKEDFEKEKEYVMLSMKKMVKDGIVPAESLLLEKERNRETGNLMIRCLPCTVHAKKAKVIDAGSKNKALSNIKAHVKTPRHLLSVNEFLENKDVSTKPQETSEEKIAVQGKFIDDKYPGKYEVLSGKGSLASRNVRCKKCNQLMKLFPERGSLSFNLEQHEQSCIQSKKRQSSLEGFCVPMKKPKL